VLNNRCNIGSKATATYTFYPDIKQRQQFFDSAISLPTFARPLLQEGQNLEFRKPSRFGRKVGGLREFTKKHRRIFSDTAVLKHVHL